MTASFPWLSVCSCTTQEKTTKTQKMKMANGWKFVIQSEKIWVGKTNYNDKTPCFCFIEKSLLFHLTSSSGFCSVFSAVLEDSFCSCWTCDKSSTKSGLFTDCEVPPLNELSEWANLKKHIIAKEKNNHHIAKSLPPWSSKTCKNVANN